MRIILRSHTMPYFSYLEKAKLDLLYKRRYDICEKFVRDNKQDGPLKSILKKGKLTITHGYSLRSGTTSVCSTIPKTLKLSKFLTRKIQLVLNKIIIYLLINFLISWNLYKYTIVKLPFSAVLIEDYAVVITRTCSGSDVKDLKLKTTYSSSSYLYKGCLGWLMHCCYSCNSIINN